MFGLDAAPKYGTLIAVRTTHMSIDSTKDLFYLALSIATVVLTFFLAWLLYYLVSMIREAHRMMNEVSASVEKLHTILDRLRDVVGQSTSHLGLIVTAVRQLVSFYQRRHGQGSNEEDDEEASGNGERRKGSKKR